MIAPAFARLVERLREPSPILVRELRALFRLPLFVRFLSLATGGIAIVVLGIASVALTENTAPSDLGRVLFDTFFLLVLFVTAFVTPLHAATSITSEREGQTYETLILSGMDPARIAIGKFLSTLSAIGLVVVALSPIVGICFLFGGVSPLEVLLGFFLVALVVTPAAAFGVAVSSRFQSTRTSILVTLSASFGLAPFITLPLMLFAVGFGMRSGRSVDGPLELIRYTADHITDWPVVAGAILLPFAVSGLLTWFLVCSAVAMLRPAAEDRITPFKVWSLALVFVALTLVFAAGASDTGHSDSAPFTLVLSMLVSGALAFVFMDDAPLPPRTASRSGGRTPFGAGIVGTTTFAIALLFFVNLLGIGLLTAGLAVAGTPFDPDDVEVVTLGALVSISLGAFTLLLGALMRTVIDNGNLVRGLVVVTGVILTVLPLLLALLLDPRAFDGPPHGSAMLILATPVGPIVSLVSVADRSRAFGAFGVLGSSAIYAVLALVLFVALRVRVRTLARELEARREALGRAIEARRAAREAER